MKVRVSILKKLIREAIVLLKEEEVPASREDMIDAYSDTYKEKHGIRPRWVRWDEKSDEEVEQMLNQLYDEPGTVSYDDDDWDSAPPADQPTLGGNNAPSGDDSMDSDPFEDLPNKMGMGRRT